MYIVCGYPKFIWCVFYLWIECVWLFLIFVTTSLIIFYLQYPYQARSHLAAAPSSERVGIDARAAGVRRLVSNTLSSGMYAYMYMICSDIFYVPHCEVGYHVFMFVSSAFYFFVSSVVRKKRCLWWVASYNAHIPSTTAAELPYPPRSCCSCNHRYRYKDWHRDRWLCTSPPPATPSLGMLVCIYPYP